MKYRHAALGTQPAIEDGGKDLAGSALTQNSLSHTHNTHIHTQCARALDVLYVRPDRMPAAQAAAADSGAVTLEEEEEEITRRYYRSRSVS